MMQIFTGPANYVRFEEIDLVQSGAVHYSIVRLGVRTVLVIGWKRPLVEARERVTPRFITHHYNYVKNSRILVEALSSSALLLAEARRKQSSPGLATDSTRIRAYSYYKL